MPKQRRWTLAAHERQQVDALRTSASGFRARDVARLVIRSPRVVPELVGSLVSGAVHGARNTSNLVWLLDTERVREVVPDAAAGAAWVDEDLFLGPLLARLEPAMHVLDLGCGGGRIARHVAPRVQEVVCADISASLLREARDNLAGFDNVRYVRTRGFALPEFADRKFDLAYAQGVFSYLDANPVLALLDEVRRTLRPRGICLFNFFTIDGDDSAREAVEAVRRAGRRGQLGGSHPRPYTLAHVKRLYEAAGLAVVEEIYPVDETTQSRTPAIVVGKRETETENVQSTCGRSPRKGNADG